MFKGIGASSGIGIGTAVLVREPNLDYSHVTAGDAASETKRLGAAIADFVEKTRSMARKMEEQVGRHQAEILLGQVVIFYQTIRPFLKMLEPDLSYRNIDDISIFVVILPY